MAVRVLSNLVSCDIPADRMQRIRAALQTLVDDLLPHLIALRPKDRRYLPKMGDKTVPFVKKALDYMRTHPEFKPGFIDVEECARDVAAFEVLGGLSRRLTPLLRMLDDTALLSGSEALRPALAYYGSVKAAAKLAQPDAVVIAADMSIRFQVSNSKSASKVAPADGPLADPDAAD
jgi:hypothetical protein